MKMENRSLKIQLAKQSAINEVLRKEIQVLKNNHREEISLLEKTIQIQSEIILESKANAELENRISALTSIDYRLQQDCVSRVVDQNEEAIEELASLVGKLSSQLDESKEQLEKEIKMKNDWYHKYQEKRYPTIHQKFNYQIKTEVPRRSFPDPPIIFQRLSYPEEPKVFQRLSEPKILQR